MFVSNGWRESSWNCWDIFHNYFARKSCRQPLNGLNWGIIVVLNEGTRKIHRKESVRSVTNLKSSQKPVSQVLS